LSLSKAQRDDLLTASHRKVVLVLVGPTGMTLRLGKARQSLPLEGVAQRDSSGIVQLRLIKFELEPVSGKDAATSAEPDVNCLRD
jgi:hypothetical protein